MVQSSQRFDEHVNTFISVFVSSSSEEVEGFVGIEIVVSIEMTADKFCNAILVGLVQVLEFVGGGELLDVETVWKDAVRLSLQQMLTLVSSDMADGGENICRMSSTAFYAVSVVDTTLSGLGVNVEVLQVVVEIDRASAEVAAEERCVSGEDGRYVDLALLAQRKCDTCKPLVELCDDGTFLLVEDVLLGISLCLVVPLWQNSEGRQLTSPKNQAIK